MNTKSLRIQDAIQNIKNPNNKIILYHVITPISNEQFSKIKENGYFMPSNGALGGQSDGYYFFTTRHGADNHIATMKDTWENSPDKDAYLVECEIDSENLGYPVWKLDYESMQDFLFDMIYDSAHKKTIKFDNIEINALDDKKLSILKNGKFSRIKSFCANDHSGLIEKTTDFLYKHDNKFRQEYDRLLSDAFHGNGTNQDLYAVKTTNKQKITKITKIETKKPESIKTNSQIDKFLSRYGGRKS